MKNKVSTLFFPNRFLLFTLFIIIFSVIIPSGHEALATAGNITVLVNREGSGGTLLAGALVEVQCTGGTFTTLGTTIPTGMVSNVAPPVGANCDDGESIDVRITKTGFVTTTYTAIGTYLTASNPNSYTIAAVNGVPYQLKVIIADELGSAFTASSLDTATFNGVAPSGTSGSTSGSTIYWAAAVSNATLVLNEGGYVNSATTNTGFTDISTSASGQTVITLGANAVRATAITAGSSVTAKGLEFQLKVVAATELGASFTTSSIDTKTFNGTTATTTSGSDAYWAVSATSASLVLNESGYVDGATTNTGFTDVSTSASGQTVITLGANSAKTTAIAAGASVTAKGLVFGHKFVVTREGDGAPLTGATLSGFSMTEDGSTGIYYCAIPVGFDGPGNVGTIVKSGYVTHSFETADRTASTDAQVTDTISDVLFQLKVVAADELGNSFTASGLDTKTFNSTSATTTSGANAYWAVEASNAALVLNEDGYVNSTTTNTGFTDVSTSASGQTVITLGANSAKTTAIAAGASVTAKGLEYGYKITNITTEVLSTDITGSVTALAVGDASGTTTCSLTSGVWYCPVVVANSDGTLIASVTLDGYVDTAAYPLSIGTTRSSGTSAQVSDTIADVKHALKVTVTKSTGGALSGATVTTGDGFAVSCTEDGVAGIYYCILPITHTGVNAMVVASGYTTNSGSFTDRSAHTDAQGTVSIILTAISTASANGAVPLLKTMNVQLQAQQSNSSLVKVTNNPSSNSKQFQFERYLKYKDVDVQVKKLQEFLNSKGFTVAAFGFGSQGKETTLFGSATKSALIKYQKANGIKPASGYFGQLTMRFVNNILSQTK